MLLRTLIGSDVTVSLPRTFNMNSMRQFISAAVIKQAETRAKKILFDFTALEFIEPEGVVVLANTIEHFRQAGVRIEFSGLRSAGPAKRYLDDSGFFLHYLKKRLFIGSSPRDTTVPFELFPAKNYVPYLYQNLMPWIGSSVNLSEDTLSTIRACLEEVFHNIDYHSGVDTGCVFAQHFPQKKRICIAISDFGIGIPTRVRTRASEASDAEALRLAVKEGWTTKTNVVNRGVGLSTLLKYITQRNSGTVLLHSGQGYLSATRGPQASNVTSRNSEWSYPGTLVHVVLRTDTLEKLEDDVTPEVFQWQPFE